MVQLSYLYMTTGKTVALTIWIFVSKVMSLLFNMLSRFVRIFLPMSKCLLISWLQYNQLYSIKYTIHNKKFNKKILPVTWKKKKRVDYPRDFIAPSIHSHFHVPLFKVATISTLEHWKAYFCFIALANFSGWKCLENLLLLPLLLTHTCSKPLTHSAICMISCSLF